MGCRKCDEDKKQYIQEKQSYNFQKNNHPEKDNIFPKKIEVIFYKRLNLIDIINKGVFKNGSISTWSISTK